MSATGGVAKPTRGKKGLLKVLIQKIRRTLLLILLVCLHIYSHPVLSKTTQCLTGCFGCTQQGQAWTMVIAKQNGCIGVTPWADIHVAGNVPTSSFMYKINMLSRLSNLISYMKKCSYT